ncbi:MAG: trypsin-like peptidase domain-containing protein [Candidatus Falkowbacteria bacterium]|nr:trypsin-like peptidase domain-containing protein [Candidatus Falkowbacteria bacterium]
MKITKYIAIWLIIVAATLGAGIALTENFISLGAQAGTLRLDEQEATIRAINRAAPGVVSITISENVDTEVLDMNTGNTRIEQRKVRRGAGSGFLISADGLIITNKHVASAGTDGKSEYKVTLNSGKQYFAQLIGKDPVNDLAILKIFDKNLPFLEMGDSNALQVGSSVIAIGNALGRYDNSATKGIVSGLGRSLMASGNNGTTENLENVIQTDAQINFGNSGGPLINLDGKVVGINVAKDDGGESIGFAIPVNEAKPVVTSARDNGRIIRSRLGVRYLIITPEIAEARKLPRSTGALIIVGENGEAAITVDSPAAKAGLAADDIIFEVDGKKIDERLPLLSYISQFGPGKKLGLKVQRGTQIFSKIVTLDELK